MAEHHYHGATIELSTKRRGFMTTPTDTPTQTLKPCPWCEQRPNSGCNYGIGGAYVRCGNAKCVCNPEIFIAANHNPDASLSLHKALAQAKDAWNARAIDDAVKPLALCIAESRDALLAGKRCAEVLIQAGGAVAVEIYEEELPLINKALASAAGLVEDVRKLECVIPAYDADLLAENQALQAKFDRLLNPSDEVVDEVTKEIEIRDALVRKMHTYLFQEPNVNDIDANAEEKHANNRAVEAMINVVRAHFNAAAGEK